MKIATKIVATIALIASGVAALVYALCKMTAISILSTANAIIATWSE